jgi:hypothetical protein
MFIEFTKDLEDIDLLQNEWNAALGIKNKKDGPILSYNPVLARAEYKRLVEKGQRDLESFKEYEIQQLKTMLSERYQVMAHPVIYNIDSNGDIYHQELPSEPFLKILQRGQAYREGIGSKEVIREEKEIEGWLKVFEDLGAEAVPADTKMAVISGPGLVEDTAYPHNFVDIFTKQVDGSVVMTRFSSPLDYDSYSERAVGQKENYFDGFVGPVDAWFLGSPIKVDSGNTKREAEEVFKDVFGKSNEVLKVDDFEKIIEECMPIINFYINVLCDPEFKPEELAIAFNAVLNAGDMAKEELKKKKTERIIYVDFESIQQRIDYLGHQKVKNIQAGCGLSGGFDLASQNFIELLKINLPGQDLLENSVAQFGVERDDYGKLEFECTKGHKNRRPYGKFIEKCCVKDCTGSVGGDGCKKAA